MKILIAAALLPTLISCSSTGIEGMKFTNKSPRGISILNVVKEERSRAYQSAEKHCAKYYKVPRVLKTVKQESLDETQSTMNFECVKPSN